MIRRATATDGAALCDLLLRCPQGGEGGGLANDRTPDFFRRASPFPRSSVLAVEGGSGATVATVTVASKQVRIAGRKVVAGYVFDLAVDPDARGSRLASRLLRQCEEQAVAWGAELLYAHVMSGNAASLATFARAGYEERASVAVNVLTLGSSGETDGPGGATGRGAERSADLSEALTPEGWGDAAALVCAAEEGQDLGRSHDGASLRAEWTGLHGWNGDVWHETSAVLGLWDYSEVARFVPSPPGGTRAEALVGGLRAGMLLGGAGDDAALDRLLGAALTRAGERGMHAVFSGADSRSAQSWLAGRESIESRYHLLAKILRAGPAERLGDRPVRVDPIDL